MSILDNEGHDPQGFGNGPRSSKLEVLCACTDSCAKDAEIERLLAALADAIDFIDPTTDPWLHVSHAEMAKRLRIAYQQQTVGSK